MRAHPLEPSQVLVFTFDGEPIEAGEGETIAVALIAAGKTVLRTTPRRAEPRGLFCNMGVCFECLVEVDGHANLRACQTVLGAGMRVRTQRGFGYADVAPERGP
jgi:predicted molibdopterin-dependent oxidoreductase YjgC